MLIKTFYFFIFPSKIAFSDNKVNCLSTGTAVNLASFASKALHLDGGNVCACQCPVVGYFMAPFS